MRIALVLLFLLALGALPGALLPQRSLNQRLVDQYFADHPTLAPLLDRLGFFDVFAAPWFAAVYLLLMISLVGCVLPRALEHAQGAAGRAGGGAAQPRAAAAPRRRHARRRPPRTAAAAVRARLQGVARVAESPDGISAEKGYLREAGNLVFHLALIGLLLGFAGGKLFGYEGQVIVQADGGQFCNTGILGYDSFRAGLRVDGTGLDPFCVKVDDFTATYLPERPGLGLRGDRRLPVGRRPRGGRADLAAVPARGQPPAAARRRARLPAGPRLHAAVHRDVPGRAAAHRRHPVEPGRPHHDAVGGRHEVPAARASPTTRSAHRRWRSPGCSRPTTSGGDVVTSVFPAPDDPRGGRRRAARRPRPRRRARPVDLHASTRPRSTPGALVKVARANLLPGQSLRLDDGTVVRFDGVGQWVNLQVSHDPAELVMLVFAIALLGGLLCSLTVRRRRFWAKITPSGRGPYGRRDRRARPHRPGGVRRGVRPPPGGPAHARKDS